MKAFNKNNQIMANIRKVKINKTSDTSIDIYQAILNNDIKKCYEILS